jgi:hypothetical protein
MEVSIKETLSTMFTSIDEGSGQISQSNRTYILHLIKRGLLSYHPYIFDDYSTVLGKFVNIAGDTGADCNSGKDALSNVETIIRYLHYWPRCSSVNVHTEYFPIFACLRKQVPTFFDDGNLLSLFVRFFLDNASSTSSKNKSNKNEDEKMDEKAANWKKFETLLTKEELEKTTIAFSEMTKILNNYLLPELVKISLAHF